MAVPTTAAIARDDGGSAGRVYALGVHATYSRRYGEHWSDERPPHPVPEADWWPYVASVCQAGRRVVLIAPVGTHFATITRFWSAVDEGLFRVLQPAAGTAARGKTAGRPKRPWVGRLVLKGTPTIIGARTPGGSLLILSHTNYADIPPAELCRSVGVTPVGPWGDAYDPLTGELDPKTHCLALTRWYRRVISEWVAGRCGPWGDTAGALSLSLWRATDGAKAVARHANEEALEVEAAALHGGRASVWYYGSVGRRDACPPAPADPPPEGDYPTLPGQAHKLDVRSMYPWLLGNRPYPVQLRGIRRNLTPDQLAGLLGCWGGVACVRLKATEPEYPYRSKDRTTYPVGEFTTTLAGPELLAALARGEVLSAPVFCRYRLGEPFQKWCRRVTDKRTAARTSGDLAAETLWKQVANCLGGKFAQKSRRWLPCPRERSPVRWGEYLTTPTAEVPAVRRRAIQGVPHRLLEGGPGGRLPAAVYAYLTAYARVWMRGLRAVLGPGCVLSQDTDGLWVTDAGLERARGFNLLDGDGPGSLRLERSESYARWWDARHYYTTGRWTLAGVASGWTLTGTGEVRERRLIEPTYSAQTPESATLLERVTTRRLARVKPDVRVGPDGWAIPTAAGGKSGPERLKGGDRGEGETAAKPAASRRRRRG